MNRTNITYEPTGFLWTRTRCWTALCRGRAPHGGFTLLEILIAIFILSIVVTLVFGSFNSIFSSADHVSTSSDIFEMGTACLDRMAADLKAIHVEPYPRYKPPDIDDDPELYRIEGESVLMGGSTVSKLRFASLAHLPFNHAAQEGIAEIVYYVQEDPNKGLSVHRADHLYPYPDFEPNPNDPVMCEQILTFKLTYFDHDGGEQDEWNSESADVDYNTPSAIGIALTIGTEASSYEFNTRVTVPTFRYKTTKG